MIRARHRMESSPISYILRRRGQARFEKDGIHSLALSRNRTVPSFLISSRRCGRPSSLLNRASVRCGRNSRVSAAIPRPDEPRINGARQFGQIRRRFYAGPKYARMPLVRKKSRASKFRFNRRGHHRAAHVRNASSIDRDSLRRDLPDKFQSHDELLRPAPSARRAPRPAAARSVSPIARRTSAGISSATKSAHA